MSKRRMMMMKGLDQHQMIEKKRLETDKKRKEINGINKNND